MPMPDNIENAEELVNAIKDNSISVRTIRKIFFSEYISANI